VEKLNEIWKRFFLIIIDFLGKEYKTDGSIYEGYFRENKYFGKLKN